MADELGLAGSRRAVEEDVEPGPVGRGAGTGAFAAELAHGGEDPLGGDFPDDVEAFDGVVGGVGGGFVPYPDAQQLAVGFEEGGEGLLHLLRGGADALEAFEGRRDAAGIDRVAGGQPPDGLGRQGAVQPETPDRVPPDGQPLLPVEGLEADGIGEPATNRFVEGIGGGVGNPDGRQLRVVEGGIDDPLAPVVAGKEAEQAFPDGTQQFVGFVDQDDDAPRREMLVAQADAGEAGGGRDVPVGVALADFDQVVPQFAHEGLGEGRLAGSGRTVEQDVGRVPVGCGGRGRGEKGLENGRVTLGEGTVEGERQGVVEGGAFVEAAFDEGFPAVLQAFPDGGPVDEVGVLVENLEPAQGGIGTEGAGDFAVGTVRGHGDEVDALLRGAESAGKGAVMGHVADRGIHEHIAGHRVQAQERRDGIHPRLQGVGRTLAVGAVFAGEEEVARFFEHGPAGGAVGLAVPDVEDGVGHAAAVAEPHPPLLHPADGLGERVVAFGEFGHALRFAVAGGPLRHGYAGFALEEGRIRAEMVQDQVFQVLLAEMGGIGEQTEHIGVVHGLLPVVHQIPAAADGLFEEPPEADVVPVTAAGRSLGHGESLGWG